jgi:hypothetical protein
LWRALLAGRRPLADPGRLGASCSWPWVRLNDGDTRLVSAGSVRPFVAGRPALRLFAPRVERESPARRRAMREARGGPRAFRSKPPCPPGRGSVEDWQAFATNPPLPRSRAGAHRPVAARSRCSSARKAWASTSPHVGQPPRLYEANAPKRQSRARTGSSPAPGFDGQRDAHVDPARTGHVRFRPHHLTGAPSCSLRDAGGQVTSAGVAFRPVSPFAGAVGGRGARCSAESPRPTPPSSSHA